jgi:signal transduction histidine kinase
VASDSFCVRRFEFFRTTSFRWAIAFAAVLVIGMGILSGFIYWRTTQFLIRRADSELQESAQIATREPSLQSDDPLQRFFDHDPTQIKIAGLFDPAGHPLGGNLKQIPSGLPPLGSTGELELGASDNHGTNRLRVLTQRLPDGRLLVLGRSLTTVHEIEEIVRGGLLVALVPMLLLSIVGGIVLSRSALRRIGEVHRTSRQIMAGQLNKRLIIRGNDDDFDRLSRIVNEMLDEIERLMQQAKGVGEDIAHDLRTPLTRLRGRLEQALSAPISSLDVAAILGTSIEDIDQILGTITAILRIAEVEHGQRRAGFREVDLADVAREAADLYEPVAEEKDIRIDLVAERAATARGDGDLLFELVANLLDNAIKFTPPGGRVQLSIRAAALGPIVRVADSGPGIPKAEFSQVLRRFYRADRSRHTPGTGLGLSLVASIAQLHRFGLILNDREAGCCIELECWEHAAALSDPAVVGTIAARAQEGGRTPGAPLRKP